MGKQRSQVKLTKRNQSEKFVNCDPKNSLKLNLDKTGSSKQGSGVDDFLKRIENKDEVRFNIGWFKVNHAMFRRLQPTVQTVLTVWAC